MLIALIAYTSCYSNVQYNMHDNDVYDWLDVDV